MGRPAAAVEVGPVATEGRGAARRVMATVAGEPLWFESSDLALAPRPEAFGSALLIPALHRGAALRLADAVDGTWQANTTTLAAILRGWWRYPAHAVAAPRRSGPGGNGVPPSATALFFSGGVDSFHVLLRGGERIDWLVALHGFDFPLGDRERCAELDASVRAVAAARGARAAVVRTNVREHPLFHGTPWERAHGGVLGGIAHLLAPVASRARIAASAPGDDGELPWGQHWRIDPLWSSGDVEVAHAGRGGRRLDKLRAIAAEPLVRDHLRVCWRNLSPRGNCSRCNKCVLAMTVLADCGELARSRAFDLSQPLAARIAALGVTRDRWHTFAEVLAGGRLAPDVAREVRALVRRSRHAVRPDVVFRRAVLRRVRSLLDRT